MKKKIPYDTYIPILQKNNLFKGISDEDCKAALSYLDATFHDYKKETIIQQLGDPLSRSGIVLSGTVEGSFISENFNKINMNHFSPGQSFGEALACVQTGHSPIQLRAMTNCTVVLLHLSKIVSNHEITAPYQHTLSQNLIRILANQAVFANLKLRIASQRGLRDRILMYFYSLMPDKNGVIHVPFTQTALAEFLGVNRSALSRELGRMQNEELITMAGRDVTILI